MRGVYTTRRRSTPLVDLLRMARELLALPCGRLSTWEVKHVASLARYMEMDWHPSRRGELRLKALWGREFRP